MRTRLLLGVLAGAFGALRFFQRDLADIVNAVLWLVGGVLIHDAIIAPLTIAVTVLVAKVLPAGVRVRVTVALVVLVTVTVTAVPVLTGLGVRPDNPTLLPRNYWGGWLVLVTLVLLVTGLAGPVLRGWRTRAGRGGRSAGQRSDQQTDRAQGGATRAEDQGKPGGRTVMSPGGHQREDGGQDAQESGDETGHGGGTGR